MALKEVESCPDSVQEWFKSAKSCENSDQYHCLRNEYSATVAGCIAPIWVEKGYCPVFNSRASKLDTEKCQSECPNEYYRSFDLYKYSGCFATQRLNFDLTTLGNVEENVTSQTSLQSNTGSSGSILAIVFVVFGLLFCAIVASGLFFYRRYKSNKTSGTARYPLHGSPESILLQQQGNLEPENTKVGHYARHWLLNKMNVKEGDLVWDEDLVKKLLGTLLKHNVLALCGQWGSGRRTLAIQTAFALEKKRKEKYQYRIIHDFIRGDIFELDQPTIMIMPDLYKPWYTESHIEEIIQLLNSYHSQERDKEIYIIATFRATNTKASHKIFDEKDFIRIFPVLAVVNLFETSQQILQGIAKKYEGQLEDDQLKQQENSDKSVGKPLAAIFYCKNMGFTNQGFLKSPLLSVQDRLNRMSDKESLKFCVLIKVMLHGGKVLKTILENDTDHWLFAEINDKTSIMKCVNELLGGYLEETNDGYSYKIIHDVITRCIFLIASKKYFNLLLRECDPYIIVECIRHKTWKEKVDKPGRTLQHIETLSLGIPTGSYLEIARVLKRRKDMLRILSKSTFFEEKAFQRAWNKS